ncbi:hypothetical protein [Flavisolibacter nicotianae]|uniref:hypothetical protein n=1 Tax=Flavisolibacter nicotianae TaxID=2364882 RepID=UPI000EB5B741|nr:hypothetical protein [Flavisolibacter nicotianae]
MKKVIVFLTAVVMALTACTKSGADTSFTPDCATPKSYAADVSPILQVSCNTVGCHASGSHEGPGALVTYQQVYNNRSGIRKSVANGSMPEGSTLTAAEKNAIICWIDNGAANN